MQSLEWAQWMISQWMDSQRMGPAGVSKRIPFLEAILTTVTSPRATCAIFRCTMLALPEHGRDGLRKA